MDFLSKAHLAMGKIPKYNIANYAFANKIFLQMKDAGITTC